MKQLQGTDSNYAITEMVKDTTNLTNAQLKLQNAMTEIFKRDVD